LSPPPPRGPARTYARSSISQERSSPGILAAIRRFRKFTVVRNPWDGVISMRATTWRDFEPESCGQADIAAFLRQLQPHPNEGYRSLSNHEILDETLDFVLRYEAMQADLLRMLMRGGLPDVVLPCVWKIFRQHYSDYYSPEARQRVADMFSANIKRFGYRFEDARMRIPLAQDSAGGIMRGFLSHFSGWA
jgi:hypothetical protein